MAKEKLKYWVSSHEFGINIPKTVEEAKRLDAEIDNTFWWDAILEEIQNVRPAFETWGRSADEIPPSYQQI